ncbi:hypothetical protein QQF64_005679 [Cirrhinus molitorella]|uniref:Secreted protein n=1 Tax=Cirrhinus molitorella TaxID=172907 RepID=A0ABR3MCY8_9TELE
MHLLYGWTLCSVAETLSVSICPSASCPAQFGAEPVPAVRAHEEGARLVASVRRSLFRCSVTRPLRLETAHFLILGAIWWC